MQLRLDVTREEGRRNDLLLRLDRSEIGAALLSIANRDRLMMLPGIPRHRPSTPQETADFLDAKRPIDDHLEALGVIAANGAVERRTIAISNRNVGANLGQIAWQRAARPRLFHLDGDPLVWPRYSCLVARTDGSIAIEDIRIDSARHDIDVVGTRDAGKIDWVSAAPRVLRDGRVARVEAIAHEFYDIRHVFAFDPRTTDGERLSSAIYRDYPARFRANVERAWQEGAPRARYFHNAIGLSRSEVIVLQREGTIEEIGAALLEAGADDGLILDNGGSVACWAWWVNDYRGGLVSPTVDYRPPATSVIAFVLKGPIRPLIPGGSASVTTL